MKSIVGKGLYDLAELVVVWLEFFMLPPNAPAGMTLLMQSNIKSSSTNSDELVSSNLKAQVVTTGLQATYNRVTAFTARGKFFKRYFCN
jgi:hypothetical protein